MLMCIGPAYLPKGKKDEISSQIDLTKEASTGGNVKVSLECAGEISVVDCPGPVSIFSCI